MTPQMNVKRLQAAFELTKWNIYDTIQDCLTKLKDDYRWEPDMASTSELRTFALRAFDEWEEQQ